MTRKGEAIDPRVKVTIRLPAYLIKRAKHEAIEAEVDLQDYVAVALHHWLSAKTLDFR